MRRAFACRSSRQGGYALVIAVLLLASLLALVLPFLFSVSSQADASAHSFDRTRAEILTGIGEEQARLAMAATATDLVTPADPRHSSGDPTPRWDGSGEIAAALRGEGADSEEARSQSERFMDPHNPASAIWGSSVSDERSRIDLNSAPPLVLAALFNRVEGGRGWLTWTSDDIQAGDGEIAVSSTAGFPPSGALYLRGERVTYRSLSPGSFLGCARGSGSAGEPGVAFLPPMNHRAGTLVLDDRVHRIARWRIGGSGQGLRRFSSVGELRRIAERAPMEYLPQRLIRLAEPYLTVHGEPGWGGCWTRWIPIRQAGSAQELTVLLSEDLSLGSRSAILQVQHAPGGARAETPCFYVARGTRGGGLVVLEDGGEIPELPGAVGRFQVRAPVNINTAGRVVLAALLTGIKLRGGRTSDRISPDLAAELADEIIALRGGVDLPAAASGEAPQGRPLRDWQDFVERFLDPAAGLSGAGGTPARITPRQRQAIYFNAENPLSSALELSTMPLCFDSGVNYRCVTRAVATGPTGRTRRAEGVFEIFQAAPVGRQFAWLGDQQRFEELFRLNRMAHWMTTGPNVQEWLRPARGVMAFVQSPDSRLAPRLNRSDLGRFFPYWEPSAAEQPDAQRYRDDQQELLTSVVQSQAAMREDVYGTGRLHHYDRERQVEGRDCGSKGRGPDVLQAGARDVGIVSDQGRLWPFTVGGWFRPRHSGDQVFLQVEADSSGEARGRITLAVEGRELVLRLYDAQGDDPLTGTVEACEHRVELGQDVTLEEDTWYHFRAIVRGARPGDILLLIDGFPQGKPRYLTWLTSAIGPEDFRIPVESTEGFPDHGVLKIGDELVEYISVSGKTFQCRWQLSPDPRESAWTGGRGMRQHRDENAFVGTQHAAGTLVELYGYASMLLSNLPTGGGKLDGALGPFAVGRLVNGPSRITVEIPDPNNPTAPNITIELGTGYEAGDGDGGQIELLDPLSGGGSSYSEAFQENGGFALVMMNVGGGLQTRNQPIPTTAAGTPIGGIEVIRYTSRQGNLLSGVQRGFMDLKGTQGLGQGRGGPGTNALFGEARAFITEWNPGITINGEREPQKQPRYWTWVVPISVKATSASDQTYLEASENNPQRIQIYHPDDEGLTEWIEYDEIYENHFVRSNAARIQSAYSIIASFQQAIHEGAGQWRYQAQQGWIGQPPEDPPSKAAEDIGRNLQMRGRYGTFNQLHEDGLDIQPVFWVSHRGMRTYDPKAPQGQRWGSWGMTSTRPGRGDRVCFRRGRDTSSSVPWYTVNWAWTPQNSSVCYAALKEVNQEGMILDLRRKRPFLFDSRDELRMLKFPSGELPAGIARVRIGQGTRENGGGMEAFDGLVDEVEFDLLGGQGAPHQVGQRANLAAYLLADDVSESGESGEILLRPNSLEMPQGVMHASRNAARMASWPQDAGVVRIGPELIAYSELSRDDEGIHMRIARGGRGFLGSEKKGHGIGDRVWLLSSLEVSELASGLSSAGYEISLESGRGFYTQGTVLIEEEVAHYTRHSAPGRDGPAILSMPRTTSSPGSFAGPDEADGALRGRYGTMVASHSMGALVYRLPFRYWDRAVITDARGTVAPAGEEGMRVADLAESSYLGWALARRGAFYQALHWKEYLWGDALLDVQALVRIDGEVPGVDGQRVLWDDFPTRLQNRRPLAGERSNPDLLWMDEPGDREEGVFNPINRPGSLLEVRFFFVYKPGAFRALGPHPNTWKRSPQIEEMGVLYSADPQVLYRVRRP